MSNFKFQPRWKEELVVIGDGGRFILEHPMGIPSVYLPTESAWKFKSPKWAQNQYSTLRQALEQWCETNNAKLYIDETADVGVDGK